MIYCGWYDRVELRWAQPNQPDLPDVKPEVSGLAPWRDGRIGLSVRVCPASAILEWEYDIEDLLSVSWLLDIGYAAASAVRDTGFSDFIPADGVG